MTLEKTSPCKVNLLLNILGRRADGFHDLETIFYPVNVCDRLTFAPAPAGIELTCSAPALPTDSSNLVHRAASAFLQAAGIGSGVRIHLEKQLPLAAGLGGGSANAAITLLGLNEMFGHPLADARLHIVAATLGSDVNFFLQPKPALATGRGEQIQPLDFFPALRGTTMLLIHPGFGIATAWAYEKLADYPAALHGRPGRAAELVLLLQQDDPVAAGKAFYNSLEAPALHKHPILMIYQEFLREHGALATLMSGSGSTTFALFQNQAAAEAVVAPFKAQFGAACWTAVVPA